MVAGTGESGGIQAPGACGPGLQGAWGPGPQTLPPAFTNHPTQKSTRRDPGPRGLWARSPGAWGPGPQGLGPGPPRAWGLFNHPTSTRFFANLLAGAWRRRGCRLKRLLRRWGPGGKRSRDTPLPPPHPPPPRFGAVREKRRGFSPSPPSATIQHAPQGRRIQIRNRERRSKGRSI